MDPPDPLRASCRFSLFGGELGTFGGGTLLKIIIDI